MELLKIIFDLKDLQIKQGYEFTSETDTEVIAHAIDFAMQSSNSLLEATQKVLKTLDGSYGLGLFHLNTQIKLLLRERAPLW